MQSVFVLVYNIHNPLARFIFLYILIVASWRLNFKAPQTV